MKKLILQLVLFIGRAIVVPRAVNNEFEEWCNCSWKMLLQVYIGIVVLSKKSQDEDLGT